MALAYRMEWIMGIKNTAYPSFIRSNLETHQHRLNAQMIDGKHILETTPATLDAVTFTSNDYLNISTHPKLIEAKQQALAEFGNGLLQSAIFFQENTLYTDTEKTLAHFLQQESALLTTSGWNANTGILQALAKPKLPIYIDSFAHMSFWEGIKSAEAMAIKFNHNDVDDLEKKLKQYGAGLIVVDSLYSTIGTLCPLREINQLSELYQCFLIVDESHAVGILGNAGQGLYSELQLTNDSCIITASLAKAISGRGGVIAGNEDVIELIRHNAYSTIFTSSLLPHDLIGFKTAIEIIKEETWRRDALNSITKYFHQLLVNINQTQNDLPSHIVPIMTYSEENCLRMKSHFENHGIYPSAFFRPATARNRTLLRFSLNAGHDETAIMRVFECINNYEI